jgi:hypothetical protein
MYKVMGDVDADNNINISIKADIDDVIVDITNVEVNFDIAEFSTYEISQAYIVGTTTPTTMVKTVTDVTSTSASGVQTVSAMLDLSNPVTITVTAQDGTASATYAVVVDRPTPSDKKELKEFWFAKEDNSFYAKGTPLGDNMFEVWVPWDNRGDMKTLVASFKLSDGAHMTHSEDMAYLQTSGETINDFTTPVAYTVWAEDCTTVEYFVIVKVVPNTLTSISEFVIDVDGCMCDEDAESVLIDEYAKRIYVRIPYADSEGKVNDIKKLLVSKITVPEGGKVEPEAGKTYDFSSVKTFTVTSPDGTTKQAWTVMVDNSACTGTDILDWTFTGDVQVGDPVIDADNHTVSVLLVPGTDLESLLANSVLDCGATICCAAGNCAGAAMDFSADSCHTCVVTAQDKKVTQDWTICVDYVDVVKPEVWTNSVLAENCDGEVDVWADSDGGYVYLVDEATAKAVNNLVNIWEGKTTTLAGINSWLAMNASATILLDEAVENDMGSWAAYPYADSVVAVSVDGLYHGSYFAFAIDAAGNVSCASVEKVYVDQCLVTVADLCDLRHGSPVYKYIVSGEVIVSYEEGNFKFVQDADCGIKVVDVLDAWPATLKVGTGLTNIKGTIHWTETELVFNPVCCYMPETSTGNTVPITEVTYEEFLSDCQAGIDYESMLVRITDPAKVTVGGNWAKNMEYSLMNVHQDVNSIIHTVFTANYIGKAIPTVPTVFQGIRTNMLDDDDHVVGMLTPRWADITDDKKDDPTDFIKVTTSMLIADPNPASASVLKPKECDQVTITLLNQGTAKVTISALYLDDASGTDEFELINPAIVPFDLGEWESKDVRVDFCPDDVGDESTTLLVEYGDGKVMEVPINGTVATIVAMDYCQDFNDSPTGDALPNGGWTGDSPFNSSIYIANVPGWFPTVDVTNMLYMRNRAAGRPPVNLVSPGVTISGTDPVVTWTEISHTGFNGGGNSSPRTIYISTDNENWDVLDTYLTSEMPDAAAGDDYRTQSYSLADYIGKTVWIRFELISDNNDQYIYWALDNFCVRERIVEPILTHLPDPVDLGGVQVDDIAEQTVTFMNIGVSVAKIKKIELVQTDGYWDMALGEDVTLPVEITDGTWAYAENGTDHLDVLVTYSPKDIGASTAKLVVTWGLYADKVYEVPLMGEGLSCETGTEAVIGENFTGHNQWWTYTAEAFQIVTITSCDERNAVVPGTAEYGYDTWLTVYDDCGGNVLADNDDIQPKDFSVCPYTLYASEAMIPMNAGETIKIFWDGIWMNDCEYCDDPFYFHIIPNYPIDGDVCETAIPLTLPVVNHFGSTVNFADDYDVSPCTPFSNYMDGNDKVYSITLEYEGYLTGSILGAYGSIHVLDKCPVEELEKRNCKASASGPNGGDFEKRIEAGTYYVIISTWAPPQTVDYLLNLSFRGLGVDDDQLLSSMKVYPNPTSGMFTVSISNTEAKDMTLELVNISGQTVYRNEVKSVYSYTEEIDASAFAKGVYYLKVNDGQDVRIEKIVVQ